MFKADISDADAVSSLFESVEQTLGQVNLVVNNAGVVENSLMMTMAEAAWDKVVDTNLKACFLVCQQAARVMSRNRFGRILNIASTCGFVGTVGQVNYSASKGGVIAMTRSMAKELSSYNIAVNCITPGFIETDMTEGFESSPQGKQVLKKILMSRPGTVEEVANMAAFLLSDDNSYMTGQSVVLDGGLSV
ncbi:SDR family oxidoreductase [Pseudoalteromonas piscicida]|uniref:SDR family oxidoreductase n=1 Tax=Pseudoalteromonas piscicida TaxID=43662 RepID=UPI001650F77A|nr:SDR family oxidoreductase [Pseudoalteromonas piscicida]